ncbi:RteC domain-containing protein [Pedobacter agri]|uniref:RteC domain-containing protein n=1 Tax=Pedobacter agri TaxID=454586 RepID=UPI00292F0D81|nr:RteC domain-containing protein [Pedobacter agri]
MEKKYQDLLSKLEREMENFIELPALERMRSELAAVRLALTKLKGVVGVSGFISQSEEVDFFKKVKPKFYSLLVLSAERYGFENARPLLAGKVRERFYEGQLDYISRFFHHHEFLYQYYRMGAVELDSFYFVRGAEPVGLIGGDLPALDPLFSTVGDYLFSKFMALERLREIVLSEMEVPSLAGTGVVRSKKGRELRWTGDSCNLIELIYGVFDCRQINDGEVDLSDLMDVFEQCFQVNLSRYFRRFTEIKRRKSMSKTRFLDEMARVVNKRIEDGDAYVPMSMR